MLMSPNLPLPGFEPTASDESTSSAEASPVRTSAPRARVPVLTVSDPACGESLRASLARFDLATRSWRTSELCGVEDSLQFSRTLPRSGMTQSGTLYLLPALVRLTYVTASGSSLLAPTPTASLGGEAGGRAMPSRALAEKRWAQGKRGLDDWVALLPTPTAAPYGSNQGGASPTGPVRPSLETMARQGLIPTPLASDCEQAGGIKAYTAGVRGMSLTLWATLDQAGLLPTPQAEDWRSASDYSQVSRGHSPQLRHLGNGRLSPRFVEWMMGYPPDWTDPN